MPCRDDGMDDTPKGNYVRMLCTLCKELERQGTDPCSLSPELARWWPAHKAWDKKRLAEEREYWIAVRETQNRERYMSLCNRHPYMITEEDKIFMAKYRDLHGISDNDEAAE